MRNNKGIISPIYAVLALVAIVVIIVGGIAVLAPEMLDIGDTATTDPYDGDIDITIAEANALDRGAAVTSTSDSYAFYSSRGIALSAATEDDFGSGNALVVGTEETITLEPDDLGTFWIYADSGTDFWVDPDRTKADNSGIVAYEEIDVDADGRDEYVFEVDVSAVKEKLTVPSRTYTMVLLADDDAITIDAPSDVAAIGTGSVVDTKIKWEMTIGEQTAARIASVFISTNETVFREDVTVTSIAISGLSTSAVEQDNPYWNAKFGVTNPYAPLDCPLVEIAEDAETEIGITVKITTTFESTEVVELTLNIYTMDADETQNAVVTDTIILGAA